MVLEINEALKEYRDAVLKFNSDSKDYAGTVDIYTPIQSPVHNPVQNSVQGGTAKRELRIVYRKSYYGDYGMECESDKPFVKERVYTPTNSRTILYPDYYYEQYACSGRKNVLQGFHSELGMVGLAHYLFFIPELLFLKGACFGERVGIGSLQEILDFSKGNKYSSPVTMRLVELDKNRSMKEPTAEESINIISSKSNRYEALLAMLYEGHFKIRRSKTALDKIDTLISKQEFEGFIPVGSYTVEDMGNNNGVDVVDTIVGPGVSFDYEGEHAIDAVGGKFISPFLAVVAAEKPEEIRKIFRSYSEFEAGLNRKLRNELRLAEGSLKHRAYRYDGELKECRESVEKCRKILLENVRNILD